MLFHEIYGKYSYQTVSQIVHQAMKNGKVSPKDCFRQCIFRKQCMDSGINYASVVTYGLGE